MKSKILIPLLTIWTFIANAQNHDLKVVVNPADDITIVSQPDIANKSQIPIIPNANFDQNMYKYKQGNLPYIYKTSVVIIRLFDQTSKELKTLGSIDKNIKVKIKIGDQEQIITPSQDELDMTDFNLYFQNYFPGIELKHNSQVTIEVVLTNNSFNINNSAYTGRYFLSNFTKYNAFGEDIGGFWFPTLQFSSNLKSTTDGVPFASLPIGLAWGGKYTKVKKKNQKDVQTYIGASLMANWLIYTQPANTSPATSNSFNLQGGTLGVLFDINDVITIGYAYGFNFRTGNTNPGSMFVLGFGSKAINFLKKDKE
jgi:hypothetical protein